MPRTRRPPQDRWRGRLRWELDLETPGDREKPYAQCKLYIVYNIKNDNKNDNTNDNKNIVDIMSI